MSAYFEYLRQMLVRFFSDLGTFFNKTFAYPWADVPHNFNDYGSYLNAASPSFGFWGWFFFVLFAILFAALIGAIIFFIVIGIRKYVRFVKRELDKDELRSQVEKLNYELYQSTLEKDKILNLKTAYMGLRPDEQVEAKKELEAMASRFPKLVGVDAAYRGINMDIPARPGLSLEEICNSFRNFAASKLGLYYTIDAIRQLFAGMGTAKLIILEGISGTGKTSLAYALGKFVGYDSAIIPVQPSWKDRSELLGYYNEFTKKFNESEFLKALYIVGYRKDLCVITLDEMNLARIEYYFAEFLSVMEMRDPAAWTIDLIPDHQDGDPELLKGGKLLIPQNVIFFGTANNDDSTFTITDKVYDRAISLFFDDKGRPFQATPTEPMPMPYTQLAGLYEEAKRQFPISETMLSKFDDLDNFVIKKFKLAFGNRILKQLESFIPCFVACGGKEVDGFDFIFTNKILKKFESLNIAFLKDELKMLDAHLDKLYGKGTFKMAHAYIDTLIKNN
ncbi:MAG: hypothetical protein E7179_00135 [Erysipelotrichaceae bacterium]|nr:hypothetical protein [Erysipelotrichaceae bacterium]